MLCFDLFGLTGERDPDLNLHREVLARFASLPAVLWHRVEAPNHIGAIDANALAVAFELSDAPLASPGRRVSLTLRTIGLPMRGDHMLTSIVLRVPGFMLRALGEAVLSGGLRGGAVAEPPVRFLKRSNDPLNLAKLFCRVYEEPSKSSAVVACRVQVLTEWFRESGSVKAGEGSLR